MAGALINTAEYLVHGALLGPQWKAAFAALGKTPTGWATFIPSSFLIGVIGIWIYAKFRPNYGPGPLTALRSAVLIWAVFWAIPMMALQPMHLFPNSLIFTTIVVGVSRPFCSAHGCIALDWNGENPQRCSGVWSNAAIRLWTAGADVIGIRLPGGKSWAGNQPKPVLLPS